MFGGLLGLLTGNSAHQYLFDGIELGGIDERIGARVQTCDELRHEVEANKKRQIWIHVHEQEIDFDRQPGVLFTKGRKR